jgi:hypothetical protein
VVQAELLQAHLVQEEQVVAEEAANLEVNKVMV